MDASAQPAEEESPVYLVNKMEDLMEASIERKKDDWSQRWQKESCEHVVEVLCHA